LSEIAKKKPRSAKRFIYEQTAQLSSGNELSEARVTNISASGIQFEVHEQIKLKSKIKLLWKDPNLGILSPTMIVVRDMIKPERSEFKYIYGAQYHNLESELKDKLVQLLKRLNAMESAATLEKIQETSLEYLLQTTEDGFNFLRQFLIEAQTRLPAVVKSVEALAEYERNSFQFDHGVAQYIQKISSLTFQCKLLTFLAPLLAETPNLKSRYFKNVTSVAEQTKQAENFRVLQLFEKFIGSDHQKKDLLRKVEESKNRMFYAKQDLVQIVYELYESIDGQNPEHQASLKVITSEFEKTLEVTGSRGFDLSNWKNTKKNMLPKILVDEVIIDNRPVPGSLSSATLFIIFVTATLVLAAIFLWTS